MTQMNLYEKLNQAKLTWDATPTDENFDKLDAIEEKYENSYEYLTGAEHGEKKQTKYLKALDYGDFICEGWRRFYVCKAGGAGNYCGLAYPSKLWFQVGERLH